MASMTIWGAGLAGSGIDTATVTPVIVSAPVIWLDFINGNNANAGTLPELPVKTFAQAVTNASSGSVIAIVAGNNEIITGTVTINKSIKVVGFGAGSSQASFTPASGATLMFNVTADDVSFEGIQFKPAPATAGFTGWVASGNKGTEFYQCRFDLGGPQGEGLLFNASADYFRVDGCSFTVVTAPATSCRAIACLGTNVGGKIFDSVFDGGSLGWGSLPAVSVTNCTRLYVKNITLAGRADFSGSTTVSYQLIGVTTSGAGQVLLT